MRSVEALEIDAELPQLLLDDVDMPARLDVLQHRARRVQHRHQRVGETIQTRFAFGVLDHFGVIGVDSATTASAGINIHRAADVSPTMIVLPSAISSTCSLYPP